MQQALTALLFTLAFIPASFAGGVTVTNTGACPSIAVLQDSMRKILLEDHEWEFASQCVVLSETRVTGPFDRETALIGETATELVLIGDPEGRRLWTLASWVKFDKPKAEGTYYAQANVNVRDRPSLSGTVIAKLSSGAKVEVKADPSPAIADGYTWVAISTLDGRTGWAAQSLLGATPPVLERLTNSTLPARIKIALSAKTPIETVIFRGNTLIIALAKRSFDQEELYPIVRDACKYVAAFFRMSRSSVTLLSSFFNR